MFRYWIQSHDYSSTPEVEKVSLAQAIRAFQEHDWQRELDAYDEADDARNCPPGIGYHDGYDGTVPKGRLLHICLKDPATVFFNFHYTETGKLLGLIPTAGEAIHYVGAFERSRVPELLRLFFEDRTEDILKITG